MGSTGGEKNERRNIPSDCCLAPPNTTEHHHPSCIEWIPVRGQPQPAHSVGGLDGDRFVPGPLVCGLSLTGHLRGVHPQAQRRHPVLAKPAVPPKAAGVFPILNHTPTVWIACHAIRAYPVPCHDSFAGCNAALNRNLKRGTTTPTTSWQIACCGNGSRG